MVKYKNKYKFNIKECVGNKGKSQTTTCRLWILTVTYFEIFLNTIPVSVLEMVLGLKSPACLNHLSDWLSFIVVPSLAYRPIFKMISV